MHESASWYGSGQYRIKNGIYRTYNPFRYDGFSLVTLICVWFHGVGILRLWPFRNHDVRCEVSFPGLFSSFPIPTSPLFLTTQDPLKLTLWTQAAKCELLFQRKKDLTQQWWDVRGRMGRNWTVLDAEGPGWTRRSTPGPQISTRLQVCLFLGNMKRYLSFVVCNLHEMLMLRSPEAEVAGLKLAQKLWDKASSLGWSDKSVRPNMAVNYMSKILVS